MSETITAVRNQIVAQLIEKAGEDAAFRALLLSEPHKALKELLGVDPVPGLTINVIEEKAGEINIVLPAALAEDELPDELLDLASGGICFSSFMPVGGFKDSDFKKPGR